MPPNHGDAADTQTASQFLRHFPVLLIANVTRRVEFIDKTSVGMTGYVPRCTKRIEQAHKRERALLGALKRGEEADKLRAKADAILEAKLSAVKSAKANRHRGISLSPDADERWETMPIYEIINLYHSQVHG